jgi:ABC-type microcin C transport system permease subunit YejB
MNPNNYNPKAREAFGKSLIDIGVGIYKAIMLLFTIGPLTYIVASISEGKKIDTPISDMYSLMSGSTYILFMVILIISFFAGHYFRKEGLRHIHESENINNNS